MPLESPAANEPKTGLFVVPPESEPFNRLEWLGVSIVILFCVAPDIFNAFQILEKTVEFRVSVAAIMMSVIARSVKVAVVVFLAMTIFRTRWESIGFRFIEWTDLRSGIRVWLTGTHACRVVSVGISPIIAQSADVFESVKPPSGGQDYLLLLFGSLFNGIAEETVVRGYLLTRLERLLHSTWAAVVLTTFLFSAYHFYQGLVPMIGIFALGLVYACMFCYFRRLWLLVNAHSIADFEGLLSV